MAVPGGPVRETIQTKVVSLDQDLPPDYVPALIKIDVNGAEHLTLVGAQETLTRHQPLVLLEYGLAARSYGVEPAQIHELLAGCGLDIFDLLGSGPFSPDQFAHEAQHKWNFLARPST
jgi:hypothetical protein